MKNKGAVSQLKQFGVGYHKAIKKLLNLSYHESNHYACQEASLLTFENLINKNIITSTYRISTKPCSFIGKAMDFLCTSSFLLKEVKNILTEKYDIDDIFDNDIDAIVSRVLFVQNREHQMREAWN